MNPRFQFERTSLKITFILIIIASITILGGNATPGVSPDANYPLFVIVDETPGIPGGDSTFILADHDSSLSSGNWIKLTGGTQHTIPSTSFKVSFPPDYSATIGGTEINLESYIASDTFTYPLSTHAVYLEGETVIANFYGSTALAGDPDLTWRLIPASQSQLETAFTNTLNGDPSDLVTLLSSSNTEWEEAEPSLDAFGDAETTFSAPVAGTYVLFLVAETSNPYRIIIYSFTVLEVTVDYSITTSVPDTVTQNSNLYLSINVNDPPVSTEGYIYGAVIIKDSAYTFDVEIVSDASVNGTSISINGEPIVEGSGNLGSASLLFPGFMSLSSMDPTEISQKLSNIIPAGNIAIGFSTMTTQTQQTVSLSTSGLNTGTYHVLMGVWENHKIAGFISDTIVVVTPPPPSGGGSSGGGGGGISTVPPAVAVIELLDPEDAYDLLKPFSAKQIAGVLEDVTSSHVIDILEFFDPEDKYAILNELSIEKVIELLGYLEAEKISTIINNITFDKVIILKELATNTTGKVLNQLSPEETASIILELSPEDWEIIESMITDDEHQAALNIEATVKKILEETDQETRNNMLSILVDMLKNLSIESLVKLLIEIAGLPETPSTVAIILEQMDSTTVNMIIEQWVSLESYESLADVMSYTSPPLLDNIYLALSNTGRLSIYQYLKESTVANLPEISTIIVSNLSVTPQIEEGEDVEIRYNVENTGELADDYIVETLIGENIVDTSSGILDAGEIKDIVFTIEMPTAGTYQVTVGMLSESFEVIKPVIIEPARFVIDSIESIPTSLAEGDDLTILVTISNAGDVSGEITIDLLLDDLVIDSKEIEIDAHDTKSIAFEMVADFEPGIHKFSVDETSIEVTVTEVKRQLPLSSIVVVVLFIIIAVAYYARTKNII